jgi:ligand-binding sensor domain-containing protein
MSYRNTKVARTLILSALVACAWSAARASVLSRPVSLQNLTVKQGLSSEMVLSIAVRGDDVWFGTYAGGATLYDAARNTFTAYTTKGVPEDKADDGQSINWKNRLPYNHVSAIQVDGDRTWFGTYFYGFGGGGISSYRAGSKPAWRKFSTFDRRAKKVVSLAVDESSVWVGSERGVSVLDKKTGQWAAFHSTADGLAGNFVNALFIDAETLWAGTNAGISRWDRTRKIWKTYAAKEGLTDLDVKALAKAGDDLWAGTSGGLLYSFDRRADRWTEVKVPASLPRGGINALAASGTAVYVCRDDGVGIYDTADARWDGLRSADGLPSDTVLCAAPAREGVWFGTDQGASFLKTNGQK